MSENCLNWMFYSWLGFIICIPILIRFSNVEDNGFLVLKQLKSEEELSIKEFHWLTTGMIYRDIE